MLIQDGMIKNIYIPKDKRLASLKKKKRVRRSKEDIVTGIILGVFIFIILIA